MPKTCVHQWDKMRARCVVCGKRKTRHYWTEKREFDCGCIDSYTPGPLGWRNWLRCNKHHRRFMNLLREQCKA
jgi:hypothetical protein